MTEEDLTVEEKAFLNAVAQGTDPSFYSVYKNRLGWSLQKATQRLQTLCDKGMVTISWDTGKTGRPTKFLGLTKKGCELLGIPLTPSTNDDGLGAPQPNRIESSCRHHWVIKPAEGSTTSQGTCLLCGQVGEFQNYIPNKAEGQPVGSLPPLFDR